MQYNVNVFPRSVIIYRHALTLLRLFGIRILFYLFFFPLFYFILFYSILFLSSVFVFNIRLLRRDENFRFKIVNIIRYSIYIYIYIWYIIYTVFPEFCWLELLLYVNVTSRFNENKSFGEISWLSKNLENFIFLENVKFLYVNLLINLISSSDFFFFFFYFFINNNNNNSHNET